MSESPTTATPIPASSSSATPANSAANSKKSLPASAPSSPSIANPSISPMPGKPASWFAAPRPISSSTPPPTPPSTAPRPSAILPTPSTSRRRASSPKKPSVRNALFVHYSTDYVFDGGKSSQISPWIESDAPNPLNVYGASKLAGEQAVESIGGKFLIFRTSWVYGPHGNNFLLTMLRLARERDRLSIVDDQIGGPTTSIELARATHSIVTGILAGRFGAPQDWTGLYHMTCGGSVSWFGFAQAIFARAAELLAVKPPTLTPIATKDYPTPAARPRNSVLSNAKLQARFAEKLSPWESALEETLQALRNAG